MALSSMGFKFGPDINKTVGNGKKKTYYATESYKVLEAIKKLRNE